MSKISVNPKTLFIAIFWILMVALAVWSLQGCASSKGGCPGSSKFIGYGRR